MRHRLPRGRRRPGLRRGHRRGRSATAARIIFAENLLGGTCARVCPVEVLCQRMRPDPRGTTADRNRRAPALRDRVGIRKRRAAAPGGRRERQARRRRGRRPGGARCGRRARGCEATPSPSTTSARRSAGSSATRSRPTGRRTSPCRRRHGCSPNSGSSSGSAREWMRRTCRSSWPRSTRSCSLWEWAPTSTSGTRATTSTASGSRCR